MPCCHQQNILPFISCSSPHCTSLIPPPTPRTAPALSAQAFPVRWSSPVLTLHSQLHPRLCARPSWASRDLRHLHTSRAFHTWKLSLSPGMSVLEADVGPEPSSEVSDRGVQPSTQPPCTAHPFPEHHSSLSRSRFTRRGVQRWQLQHGHLYFNPWSSLCCTWLVLHHPQSLERARTSHRAGT